MTTYAGPQTWIITGASKGLGRSLAEAALRRGDRVVAAVRDVDTVADLHSAYGDSVTAVRFDATDTDTVNAGRLVDHAVNRYGRLDVLVNNAGRALIGAAEEVTDAQLRELMALHLFGPAELVRAALPVMRAQHSGTIVQMSSQGGRMSFPGASTYGASKFALEGWSESVAAEVAPFGIRVVLVEPSRFRTSFNAADTLAFTESSAPYRAALDAFRVNMAEADGVQEGDPDRAAAIIADVVHSDDVPLRLPLGAEAVRRLTATYRRNLDEVERWAETARSADFPGVAESVRPV
ncbi:MAG: SDR family oxidoreductase [Mycobacterium sp.]